MSHQHGPLSSPRHGLHILSALALIYSSLLLRVQADTPEVCAVAAGNLLTNLALEQPARYSSESCEAAPTTSVCDISSVVGPCSAVPTCQSISTRIDASCTPVNEATGCCSTFLALPCAGCPVIPLACLQFCFDTSAVSDAVPAPPSNTTDPPPADPPAPAAPAPEVPAPMSAEPAEIADPAPTADPAVTEDPTQTAEPALTPPALASAADADPEADLTPTGMPRQIIVKTISAAPPPARRPAVSAVLTAAAVAAALLHGAAL